MEIAIDPTGRFAYVTESDDEKVRAFTINQSTGDLTFVELESGATSATGVAVDPAGKMCT